jgi:hypothetical protein
MEKEEKYLAIIQMSCRTLSVALDELLVVNEQKSDKRDAELMNMHPFKFYRVSLQYLIVMELCKLLEPDTKDDPRNKTKWEKFESVNVASVSKISRIIYELKGEAFHVNHIENKKTLNNIRKSTFYGILKTERDKKLGHSDGDYEGNPYSIKTFNELEIREAKTILDQIDKVFERCTNAFDGSHFMFQYNDNQTRIFIDYHIVFEEYFNKNLMKAVSEGYTINKKRNGLMPRKK